eukprot:15469595-Alexandrium_andersonii.AAC.1
MASHVWPRSIALGVIWGSRPPDPARSAAGARWMRFLGRARHCPQTLPAGRNAAIHVVPYMSGRPQPLSRKR